MPWQKVTVDSLIDYKEENRKSLGDFLSLFDRIMCVYNDMKAETIKLDQSLQHLHSQSCSEGGLQAATVSFYNTALVNYSNALNVLLNLQVPSESGIAAKIIKSWVAATGTHNAYKIAFKMSDYNWIRCNESCVVDNMIVTTSAVPCPSTDALVVNIGCSTITIDQFDVAGTDWETFKTLLCTGTPNNLHQLISHFNKNINTIEQCVAYVNSLIEEFELL